MVVGAFFLLGAGMKGFVSEPERIIKWLNNFIIHLAYPAVILSILPTMQVSADILIPTLSYWLLIPVVWIIVSLLSKWLGWSKAVRFVVFIICICGNTAFLGVPLVSVLLPQESVAYALIYDQFGTFLGLSTVVIILLARYQHSENSLSLLQLLRKLLLFTPFSVLLISLLFPIAPLLVHLDVVISALSRAIVPAAMLVIGLTLSFKVSKDLLPPLLIILSLKMLILPALVYVMLWLFGVPTFILSGIVLQVAAAPMITAAILLISAKILPSLVSAALSYGTLFGFLTLPVWAYFL